MARGSKGGADDVIDVEVVDDSADAKHSKKGARGTKPLSIGTVVRPCLVGIAVLSVVGALLPH
jgi:hypothetical protein